MKVNTHPSSFFCQGMINTISWGVEWDQRKEADLPLRESQRMRVQFNNQLLLQLHLIRNDSCASLKEIQALFTELCTDSNIAAAHVGHLIQTCLYQLRSVNAVEMDSFLSKELASWVDWRILQETWCDKGFSFVNLLWGWWFQHCLTCINHGICPERLTDGDEQLQRKERNIIQSTVSLAPGSMP